MRLRNYNRIKTLQREISRLANQTRNAKHFLTVPGVGDTIMAYMCVLLADPTQFSSGRQFAAYLGLVPMHTGSGGKTVTTKIPGRCDKLCELCWYRALMRWPGRNAGQTG